MNKKMPFVNSKFASLHENPSQTYRTLDSVQEMFVGASMRCAYAFFTFAFYMTAEHLSDFDWSVILTLGSVFHTLGWYALLHKIMEQKSVAGVSLHTVELLIVVYVFRLWTTTRRSGYLPVDSSGDGFYQAADFVGLAIALVIRRCMVRTHRTTYDERADTLNLRKALPLCVFMAVFIHGDLNDSFIFDTLYYVSVNVETLAMMPQLWMFTQECGEIDGMTSHFVVMQTLGRICSVIFWWYGMGEIGEYTTYNVAGVYLMFAHVAQVLQSLDFTLYYAKAQLTGARMVLPGL
jgi:uncharacterized protein with PQ loop repeat